MGAFGVRTLKEILKDRRIRVTGQYVLRDKPVILYGYSSHSNGTWTVQDSEERRVKAQLSSLGDGTWLMRLARSDEADTMRAGDFPDSVLLFPAPSQLDDRVLAPSESRRAKGHTLIGLEQLSLEAIARVLSELPTRPGADETSSPAPPPDTAVTEATAREPAAIEATATEAPTIEALAIEAPTTAGRRAGSEHTTGDLLIRHRQRERTVHDAKLAEVLGRLQALRCEVVGCGFDFHAVYGSLGSQYADVHVLQPLAALNEQAGTDLDQVAIVCANCHAMIHRHFQCRSLEDIAKTIAKSAQLGNTADRLPKGR